MTFRVLPCITGLVDIQFPSVYKLTSQTLAENPSPLPLQALLTRISRHACVSFILLLLATLLAITALSAHAGVIQLTDVPAQSLGTQMNYLIEEDQPLNLAQAMAQHRAGRFQPGQQHMLNFGIGSHPVWLHLEVNNPTTSRLQTYLVGGVTWLDRLDVYVVQSEQLQIQVYSGDETLGALGVTPAIGYALPLYFVPGRNDIYLRIDSIDPMVLPIELMTKEKLEEHRLFFGYFYGYFYGFLAALCIYNLLLFAGLREHSYLYYSLGLLSIILCNISYTGHGLAWLWPNQLWLQRYVILVLMVLYGVFGLLFASCFLSLAEHAPRTMKVVRWFFGLGLGAMALSLLTGSHLGAALVAFIFMSMFTVGMFLLGVLAVRQGRTSGRYFLAATFFGLIGVGSTDLAVWGKIPFTFATFHAVELGLIIEATLLAIALTHKVRQYQQANHRAEQIARQDSLTGLNNRRAFMELAGPYWSSANRANRPLSLIMMDIDHFKQINDQYGHRVGDDVLEEIANLLRKYSRASDIVARWGGEEFIWLLPETDLMQAASYAERIRHAISEIRVPVGNGSISLTASFGIAERAADIVLKDMIHMADVLLYKAKKEGRNRVSYSTLAESFA